MVCFPGNSSEFEPQNQSNDAARLDAILPEVLRRYGLTAVSGGEPSDRNPPGERLRSGTLFQVHAVRLPPTGGLVDPGRATV